MLALLVVATFCNYFNTFADSFDFFLSDAKLCIVAQDIPQFFVHQLKQNVLVLEIDLEMLVV